MTPEEVYPTGGVGIWLPEYASGLSVETERDMVSMTTGYHVSLHVERLVRLDETLAMRTDGEAAREVVRQAVRQMQDEAVTALGLQHWRDEIRRERHAEELRERRRILLALRDAVRGAGDNADRAALLVQDAIDAVGVV